MNDDSHMKAFDEGGADDALRRMLAGHRVEPDPGLWKSISRKLLWREILRLNFTNLTAKHIAIGVATLLVVVSGVYFVAAPHSETVLAKQTVTAAPAPEQPVAAAPAVTARPALTRSQSPAPAEKQAIHSGGATVAASPVGTAPKTVPAASGRTKGGSSALLASNTSFRKSRTEASEPGPEPLPAKPEPVSATSVKATSRTSDLSRLSPLTASFPADRADTLITLVNPAGVYRFRKADRETQGFISAGLAVAPELAFYSNPDKYTNANVWCNGTVTWHISRFSLASGIGIGFMYDRGTYRAEYISRDSVGYYTGVTSYTVGSSNEIIFQTESVSVYDSLGHQADARTQDRYTYLQIPLLAGYRFIERGRFSAAFQAGPAVSFLVGTHKAQPVIEYRNARIIRVDDATPVRNTVNWQLWGSLFPEMRLSRQTSLFFEPSVKYYLSPPASQEQGKNLSPFSVGLGIGLQFNFGQKPFKP